MDFYKQSNQVLIKQECAASIPSTEIHYMLKQKHFIVHNASKTDEKKQSSTRSS